MHKKRLLNFLISLWIVTLPIAIVYFKEVELVRKMTLAICLVVGLLFVKKIEYVHVKQFLVISLGVIVFSFYGYINGYGEWAFQEGVAIFATVIPVYGVITLHQNSLIDQAMLKKTIIISMYLFFLFNGILFLCFLPFDILADYKMMVIKRFLENNPSFDLQLSGFMGILPRLDNGANLFPYLLMFFAINDNKDSKILWLMSFFACVIGNSRIVIACYVVLVVYYVLRKIKDINLDVNSLRSFFVSILFLFATISLFGDYLYSQGISSDSNILNEYITGRFEGDSASESNRIRGVQIAMTMDSFQDNIMIGVGLGGYISECVTDIDHPWNIEMMPLALLMQIGVFGCIGILANFFWYYLHNVKRVCGKTRIIPFCLAALFWLFGASLQGNLLIGNFPGCILVCLYIMSCENDILYKKMI